MHGLPVGTISLAGAALFAWPFLGTGLPDSTPAWVLMIACVAALLFVELGTRQLDSRAIALLAAIAAIDTALRLAVIVGIGGFNPIFFLVLCAGFVFGPSFGFLAGALSARRSSAVGSVPGCPSKRSHWVGSAWRRESRVDGAAPVRACVRSCCWR